MDRVALANLNAILRRDATDTTYKYALLRALVEIADESEQHVIVRNDSEVELPLGLIVEKWLFYYYPVIERYLPQKRSADPRNPIQNQIAFLSEFQNLIAKYRGRGGFRAFARDYRGSRVPVEATEFLALLKKMRYTITRYPMKHLGFSVFQDYYRIVWPLQQSKIPRGASGTIDPVFLIRHFGTFAIRRDLYDLFRTVGGFITGTDAILYQWASFSANAVKELNVSVNQALDGLLVAPEADRNVVGARKLYISCLDDELQCVWSGKKLTKQSLAVDHAIPFAIWGNNDLWNLVPAHSGVNAKKRDRIPDPELVIARRDNIAASWTILRNRYADVFDRELSVSLAGLGVPNFEASWELIGIERLAEKCHYLIAERGFEAWKP